MKNALTIFRRDFAAYYTSPIGYIYMIVFLLISVGLYMTTFFVFPVADMRNFFGNVPLMMCIFIPAVTMRVWAEERKENTWEMLLTFPMRAWELVFGKFLASLAFFGLTLVATFTIPVMLISLGDPDMGAIVGGYAGTFLLGAFFLAIGIFVSGFCKDQIVAFVVTLLVCFGIFLVGTDFVASYLNNLRAGLGTLLSDALGVLNHYMAFARGVVEVGDILYFLVWTGLFLGLNMWFIEGRSRPGARLSFTSATVVCVGIGLAFNTLISGQSFGRFDLTENKIYTVSPATRSILQSLDASVQVNLYITPRSDMPTRLNRLEQDITDKLEELRLASGGRLRYTVVPMRAANVLARGDDLLGMDEPADPDDESRAIEERMLDKGVRPFEYQDMAEDQITTKLVYSSIGVAYREYPEEVIPQVVPENLDELEYLLMNVIYKMTIEEPPLIALMAPEDAVPEEMRQLYAQLGQQAPPSVDPYSFLEMLLEHEKYAVQRIQLTQRDPIPDDADLLVVVNPRQMNARQLYEINRALVSGMPVMMAVQSYEWDYQVVRDRMNLNQNEINPGVNPLLERYGLRVSDEILMDVNHFPLRVSSGDGLSAMLGLGQPINLPMHIIVTGASMDRETSITSALASVMYLWGTALDINEQRLAELGLDYRVLMTTSDRAWTVSQDAPSEVLHAALTQTPESGAQYPLMVMVEGQFPDVYEDRPRPTWPPAQPQPGMPPEPQTEEDAPEPIASAPGRFVLVGGARMFSDDFLRSGDGLDLFLNTVDAMALGEELLDIRARKPADRLIQRPAARTRMFWQVVNYGLVNLIIAGIGLGVFVVRRQARNAYTMSFSAANPKA